MTSNARISQREYEARLAKAHRIADALVDHGCTADQARALPVAGQRMAAELAGVRPASPDTWAVVVAVLATREREAAA